MPCFVLGIIIIMHYDQWIIIIIIFFTIVMFNATIVTTDIDTLFCAEWVLLWQLLREEIH